MSTFSALQRYVRTVDAIQNHIEENKAIFDDHQRLVMQEIDARSDVEDEAALEAESLAKEPLIVGSFRLIVHPQTMVVYNDEKIAEIEKEKGISLKRTQSRPPRIVISKVKED